MNHPPPGEAPAPTVVLPLVTPAPPSPPLHRPRRRVRTPWWRRRPGYATLAVTVAAALAVGVAAARHDPASGPAQHGAATAASTAPAPTPSTAPSDAPLAVVAAEAQRILTARARAVTRRDEDAFLADVLPGDSRALARQQMNYRSLSRLPLDVFNTRLWPGRQLRVAAATSSYGKHVWVLPADTEYSFHRNDQGGGWYPEPFTFVARDGRWWLASDQLGDREMRAQHAGTGTGPSPWLGAETWTALGRRSIVVGTARERSQLPGIARRVDAAVAAVVKLWPEDRIVDDTKRRVVVVASGDPAELRRLLGSTGVTPAALTMSTRPDDGGDTGYQRQGIYIVLNAHDRSARGARVLRHEVTHALVGPREYLGMPTWLAEGSAEYTAYRDYDAAELLEKRGIEQSTGRALVAGAFRIRLASSATFYRGSEEAVSAHYTHALLVCAYVADRYGAPRLVRLHDKLGTILSKAETAELEPEFIRTELGVSRDQLLADTARWVQAAFDERYR